MNEDSWKKMKDLYLAVQMGSNAHKHGMGKKPNEWRRLKTHFFQFRSDIYKNPSLPNHVFYFKAHKILQELEAFIKTYSSDKAEKTNDYYYRMIDLKMTHSMICSVIEICSERSPQELSLELKKMITSPDFQALDKGVKFFSDALLFAYHNYGELSQSLAFENIDEEPTEEEETETLIYLSSIMKKNKSSHQDPTKDGFIDETGKGKTLELFPDTNLKRKPESDGNFLQAHKIHEYWKDGNMEFLDDYFPNVKDLGDIILDASPSQGRALLFCEKGILDFPIFVELLHHSEAIKNFIKELHGSKYTIYHKRIQLENLLEHPIPQLNYPGQKNKQIMMKSQVQETKRRRIESQVREYKRNRIHE
jgi:hypothetical protein